MLFGVTFVLQICYMARKTDKICLVCGNGFKATASGKTCSGACRIAMKRMLDNGRRPDFYLIAKSKGQSVPEVKNLNKQSTGSNQKIELKAAENESVNTTPKRFMSDAMKKRLGL